MAISTVTFSEHTEDSSLRTATRIRCPVSMMKALARRVHLFEKLTQLEFTCSRLFDGEWSLEAFNDLPQDSLPRLRTLKIACFHRSGCPAPLPRWLTQPPLVTHLELRGTAIEDINVLANARMPSLEYLELRDTNVTDVSPLATATLPKLRSLTIASTPVNTDSLALANLTNLHIRRLTMCGNQIHDLARLWEAAPELEYLYVRGSTNLRTLPSVLFTHPTLKAMTVERCRVAGVQE